MAKTDATERVTFRVEFNELFQRWIITMDKEGMKVKVPILYTTKEQAMLDMNAVIDALMLKGKLIEVEEVKET